MDSKSLGLVLVAGGLVAALIGVGVWTGALGWFGRLPGDLRHEGDNVKIYVPLASMLLVSGALSLAFMVLSRLR